MVRWEKIGLRAAGRGGSLGDLWVEEEEEEERRRRSEAEAGTTTTNGKVVEERRKRRRGENMIFSTTNLIAAYNTALVRGTAETWNVSPFNKQIPAVKFQFQNKVNCRVCLRIIISFPSDLRSW